MNFQHSEDRRMLADTLERFMREKYGFETRGSASRSRPRAAAAICGSASPSSGMFAALFDEAHGGMGGTGFDIMVVFEAARPWSGRRACSRCTDGGTDRWRRPTAATRLSS